MNAMKMYPVYFLEIIITFISGIISIALTNHLVLEKGFPPWIGSIISSMFFAGFLISTLLIGHLSDKFGQKRVLKFIIIGKLFLNSYYIIPITSDFSLFMFSIVFFIDGALNGIFWPTVQNFSSIIEKNYGSGEKKVFMARYNFSWNLGFLLGMITGTIFVYFVKSNYYALYLPVIAIAIGVVLVTRFFSEIPELNDGKSGVKRLKVDIETEGDSAGNTMNEPDNTNNNDENNPNKTISAILRSKTEIIPAFLVFMCLFSHSLTDGALVIIMPLRVPADLSFLAFFFMFIRNIAMTTSTTLLSRIHKTDAVKGIAIAVFSLFLVWIFMIYNTPNVVKGILLFLSGLAQGSIYALGMTLVSEISKDMKSSKPFSIFQSTMSGGRLTGPLLIGFGSLISLEFAITLLVIYDLMTSIAIIGGIFVFRAQENAE